jgi:hypothetical protein
MQPEGEKIMSNNEPAFYYQQALLCDQAVIGAMIVRARHREAVVEEMRQILAANMEGLFKLYDSETSTLRLIRYTKYGVQCFQATNVPAAQRQQFAEQCAALKDWHPNNFLPLVAKALGCDDAEFRYL